MSTSDVIHTNKTHPDFRYSRTSSSTLAFDDLEEYTEILPSWPTPDDDLIQPHFRRTAVDRNREWSAMKRTSTARSSLHSSSTRFVPEVSDIRPEVAKAGKLLGDDSSMWDIDDAISVTENQLGARFSTAGK